MEKKKRSFTMNTLLIILIIAVVACLLTYIIPAGSYVRENKMVVPDSFAYTENTPVSPLEIPMYIVKGYQQQISLFLVILFGGGALHFVSLSGALESLVAVIVKKLKNRTWIIFPVLTALFAALCTSRALTPFIPFAPVLASIAVALGYDPILGVATLILGGGIGFSTGTLQQSTTLIAQSLAGLAPLSGLGYRFVCLVLFYILTAAYIIRYALKIKKDPSRAIMKAATADSGNTEEILDKYGPMTGTRWAILGLLVATLAILVAGSLKLKWQMDEFSVGFMVCAVAMGIVLRLNPDRIVKEFFKGASGMLFVGSLVCAATAISLILSAGGIMDTVVYGLVNVLMHVPHILQGPAMFILNIFVNVFISSGSGQAAVVIPILTPVADMIGMTRQTMILGYNFGDGLSNYVLPTVGSLMGILGMGNVPYDKWMKFMWKLFLLWVLLGCILMMIAQGIGYS